MNVAQYIRLVIFDCGSQSELTALLNIHQGTWSRYETGTHPISLSVQKKLVELAEDKNIKFDTGLFFRELSEKEIIAAASARSPLGAVA